MITKIAGVAGIVGLALLTGVAGQAGIWLWDNVLEEKATALVNKCKEKQRSMKSCKFEIV